MFQRLKNAVSSAFEDRSPLPPTLPVAVTDTPKQFSPSVMTRSAQRKAPTTVACDSILGLVASVVSGDQLLVFETTERGVRRHVIPIREDQEWITANFVPGTGLLLLLSDTLVLLVDVDRALCVGGGDEEISKALYLRPSTTTGTCLSVFAGLSFAVVGTSTGTLQFAKFCGLLQASSGGTTSGRQFLWSQYSADVYSFLTRDAPTVFHALPFNSSEETETESSGLPLAEACSVTMCEQYPNDPNAFLCVLNMTAGVTKVYLLENRLSAFFLLPPEDATKPILACAVTPGGGFALALQDTRLFLWNEQSGKRKDRTTPVHFVVDLPFLAPANAPSLPTEGNESPVDPPHGRRRNALWLSVVQSTTNRSSGSKGSASLSVIFIRPDNCQSICEVQVQCEAKMTESIREMVPHLSGSPTTLSTICPWTRSPWKGSWTREDMGMLVACADGHPLLAINTAPTTRCEDGCEVTPLRFCHQPLAPTLWYRICWNDQDAAGSWSSWKPSHLPPRGTALMVQQQRDVPPCVRSELNIAFAVGSRYDPAPFLHVGPLFDTCIPLLPTTDIDFRTPSRVPAAEPYRWENRWSRGRGNCVIVPTAAVADKPGEPVLVVYVATLPDPEATPHDRVLVVALMDPLMHCLISWSESLVSFLPQEGDASDDAPDMLDVQAIRGTWSAVSEQVAAPPPRPLFDATSGAISVVVRLKDGSYVFQNAFAHPCAVPLEDDNEALTRHHWVPPPVSLPSILFPASDPTVGFTCSTVAMPSSSTIHVDPVSPSDPPPISPAMPEKWSLVLLALTARFHVMAIDVCKLQVVGLKPLFPEGSSVVQKVPNTAPIGRRIICASRAPAPFPPPTIFLFSDVLSTYTAFRLPSVFAMSISVARLVLSTSEVAKVKVQCHPFGGASTSVLTVACAIRIADQEEPSMEHRTDDCPTVVEEEAETKDGDEGEVVGRESVKSPKTQGLTQDPLLVVSWVASCDGQLFAMRNASLSIPRKLALSPQCATIEVSCAPALASGEEGQFRWELDVSFDDADEAYNLLDYTTVSHAPLGGKLIGGCSTEGTDVDVVCAEILSLPSRLSVGAFVQHLPHASKTEPLGRPLCFQVNNRTLLIHDAVSIVESIAPVNRDKSQPSNKQPNSFSNVALGGCHSIQFPPTDGILDWNLECLQWKGKHMNLCYVVSRNPVEPHVCVHLHNVGTKQGCPLVDPIKVPVPFPFSTSLPDTAGSPSFCCRVEVSMVNEEFHVYCFFFNQAEIDVVHVLLSETSTMEGKTLATTWPPSRRLPSISASTPAICGSELRSPAHLLPVPPSNASATQKEQGFFKRLIVSSLDSQVEKIEALCAPVRVETYEDMLDRIIAPAERKLGIDQKVGQSDAEKKRRELLGGKYEASQRGAGSDRTRGALDQTKQQMNENMQLLNERGEKIDKVQTKSELLANETAEFAELCRKLKEKQRNRWF